jgi:hypothetical protein
MSSDWTQILGVNHVVRTGEESRVSIWWCRRGGSAPSYLITRASGNTGLAAAIRIIDAIDTGSPVHRLAVSSKVSVLQDVSASDRQEAFITGLFPGTDAAVYDWNDALTGTGTETQAVTVIDASRIGFSLPELVFDGSNGVALDPITVTAFGLDARDDTPATPYTLTDTLWTIQGGTGVVAFSGPVATATGVTVVVEPVARGTTTIVVTANNQQGQTITGTLTVEVLTAYDVTLSIV